MTISDTVSVLALAVAALAMVSAAWQAALTRQHNRLSVRPFLDGFRDRTVGSTVTLDLVNNGIGIAIVKRFALTFGDKQFPINDVVLPPLIQSQLDKCPCYMHWKVLTPNSPVRSGQTFLIFECKIKPTDKLEDQEATLAFIDKVGFVVEYESLYGEKFKFVCPQHIPGA